MTTTASQITSLTVVYSTVYSDADQRKHQRSASLTFVWGIHRDRWIPRTKGKLRGKCFHLMTSSCDMSSLVQIMFACRLGHKPLSEPMMTTKDNVIWIAVYIENFVPSQRSTETGSLFVLPARSPDNILSEGIDKRVIQNFDEITLAMIWP